MSLSFPTSPTVGQTYQGWVWDGDSWTAKSVSLAPLAIRTITNTGIYTPSPGMVTAIVECVGSGGGGAGVLGAAATNGAAGGGGSGSYARKFLTAQQIGASQAVTISAPGAGGAVGNNAGQAGGDVSFGSPCVARGGGGGGPATSGTVQPFGGAGGDGPSSVGDFTSSGEPGEGGFYNGAAGAANAGGANSAGGSSVFGGGAASPQIAAATRTAGLNAGPYGSGGSGAVWAAAGSGGTATGGNGSAGVCIVTEFGSSAPTLWTPPTVTSGNRALLTRQVVSTPVASVDFTAGIDTTYDEYEITVINAVNASENASLWLRVSTDGGATFAAANYQWAGMHAFVVTTASGLTGNSGVGSLQLGPGVAANTPYNQRIWFNQPWQSTFNKRFQWDSNGTQTTNSNFRVTGAGAYQGNVLSINGVRLLPGSGNFTAGTFNLYGIAK